MPGKILKQDFFDRETATVAQELLGKFLTVKLGNGIEARAITEVEAYIGPQDKACHARHGKTGRNFPLFGEAGNWYVYLCNGVHWMLNIVTEEHGHPAAVLIRGVEGFSGPGRLTKALRIDQRFQNKPATRAAGLWIEDRGTKPSASSVRKGPRVGIDFAGPYWAKRKLRFWVEDAS